MEIEDYFPEEKAFMSNATYLGNCFRYHYTDIDSVIKILDSRCLWLMHYSTLNDSSEGRYILENILNKSNSYKNAIDILTTNLFLFSFSLYGNLLSQWRGYGNINIGFDYEGMKSDLRNIEDKSGIKIESSGILFSECSYLSKNDDTFNRVINDIENRIGKIIGPYHSSSDQYELLSIGAICFSIKHPGFNEEQESRIYSYLWNRESFSYNSKQYVKLHFSPCRVRRIVIGPSEEQDFNMKKIEEFVSSHREYEKVELVKSTIPFIKRDDKNKSEYSA
jgi:hypothetical protein